MNEVAEMTVVGAEVEGALVAEVSTAIEDKVVGVDRAAVDSSDSGSGSVSGVEVDRAAIEDRPKWWRPA